MLAAFAIFAIVSLIASIFVIAASMLSSRLNNTEEHYFDEEVELNQRGRDARASETSLPSS